jgi:hypothetical protein
VFFLRAGVAAGVVAWPRWVRDSGKYFVPLREKHTKTTLNNSSIIEIAPISAPSAGFRILNEFSNGGRVEIIDGYKKVSDYTDLKTIARDFAMKGHKVQITTSIHYKDARYKQVFGKLIGTAYERKCPDLIIDGKFYEYESYTPPFRNSKISHMIAAGLKQSSRIIINNNKGAEHRSIKKNIHNRIINERQHIDEVWVYEKGRATLLYIKSK